MTYRRFSFSPCKSSALQTNPYPQTWHSSGKWMSQGVCCSLCSQHHRFQGHDRIPTVCNKYVAIPTVCSYSQATLSHLHNQKRKSDHGAPGWLGDMSHIKSSPSSWQEPQDPVKLLSASLNGINWSNIWGTSTITSNVVCVSSEEVFSLPHLRNERVGH